MDYIEVTVNTADIEAVSARLEQLGVSFIIEDEKDFKTFLEENKQYWDYVDESLENSFKGLSRVKFYVQPGDPLIEEFPEALLREVRDEDWENNWKQYYKPIKIGKLTVVPEWEEKPAEGISLVLDPGLTFGTGSHATTHMCLEAIQEISLENASVLDLGCGSGILGIGAMLLGAKECTSIDIDDKSPKVVNENAELNGVHINALAGDVLGKNWSGYDVVLANIVADVIVKLIPKIKAPYFICSGIIDGREDEIESLLKDNGFDVIKHFHEDEWNCYISKSVI